MISIPITVNVEYCQWQTELWWWNHQLTYGDESAQQKALAIVIDKNHAFEADRDISWLQSIPHEIVSGVWTSGKLFEQYLHLNIQRGLRQMLDLFPAQQVLEITDCDMFHMRPHPVLEVAEDEIIVCDLYEDWHLRSRSSNRWVIDPLTGGTSDYYNGGFVPLIGQAQTFRRLLDSWEESTLHILYEDYYSQIKWWAGMFGLQVACEKNRVRMVAKDWCYIPRLNDLKDQHYAVHYSVDTFFDKRKFPYVDIVKLPQNLFYTRVREWMKQR